MKRETALRTANDMPLPDYAKDALRYDRHPQQRTLAFHTFYGQPIRSQRPDRQFSHMDDQRVAFRASFILSEVFELLEKGLGVKVTGLQLQHATEDWGSECLNNDTGIEDNVLCDMIHGIARRRDSNGFERDLVEVVDALGDLNVVVNGFAIELGVDMRLVDQEVCASNFTKAGEDGQPVIGDGVTGPVGKVMKGPKFVEPQLYITLGLGEA